MVCPEIAKLFWIHWYVKPLPVLAINNTEEPSQKVVGPPALIEATDGLTVNGTVMVVPEHPASVGVTE